MKNTITLINQLKTVSAGLILLLFFGLISSVNAQIVSNQSGDWGNPATWVGGQVPGDNDDVVIASGHTVELIREDVEVSLQSITIQANGILDLNEFQIVDVRSFLNDGASATLRTRQHFIEATNDNPFYENNVSIVEIDGTRVGTRNFIIDSRTEFPNLVIIKREINVELDVRFDNVDIINIRGYLDVSAPRLVVDDGAFVAVQALIGNPANDTDCIVRVAGDINVTDAAIRVEIDQVNLDQHVLDVAGNITIDDEGFMGLTREFQYHYLRAAQHSVVDLYLSGNNNTNLTLNGASSGVRLNRLIINKAVNAKATLTSSNNNFRLYGQNNHPSTFDKALYIQQGILELGDNIIIPSLSEEGDYILRENSGIIVNGNNTLLRFKNFVSDLMGDFIVDGNVVVLDGTFSNLLNVELRGSLNIESRGFEGVYIDNDIRYDSNFQPSLILDGGRLRVGNQIRRMSEESENGALNLTVINGGGIFISGENPDASFGMLEVFGEGSSFTFGGQGLTVISLINGTSGDNGVADIHLVPETYTLDGSPTIQFSSLEPNTVFSINSTIMLPNVILTADANASVTLHLRSELRVSDLLRINNYADGATLDTHSFDLFLGGQYLNGGGTFIAPEGHTVHFYGENENANIRDFNTTTEFYNVTIEREVGAEALTLLSDISINGDLTFTSGEIGSVGNNSINLKGDIIGEASCGFGTTVHFLGETGQQSMEQGTFENVEINNADGVVTRGNVTINRDLIFTNGSLDIDSHLLTLGERTNIAGASPQINTSGIEGMQGVKKLFPFGLYTGEYTFPVLENGNEASVTIDIVNADLEAGSYITVKPIGGISPLTKDNDNDTELAIYWDIEQNGFDLENATVSHVFNYDAAHEQHGDLAEYIPGIFTEDAWFIPTEEDPDKFVYVDEVSKTITFNALGDGFQNQQDALLPESKIAGVFTAGLRGEFLTIRRFISRLNGGWSSAGTWNVDIDGDDVIDFVNIEGQVPQADDIVIINPGFKIGISNDNQRAYYLRNEGLLLLYKTTGHRFNNIIGDNDNSAIYLEPFNNNGVSRYDFDVNFNNIDEYYGEIVFEGNDDATLPVNLERLNSMRLLGNGDKVLSRDLEVREKIALGKGNLISSNEATLTITEDVAIENAVNISSLEREAPGSEISSSSYVVGPMIIKGVADELEYESIEFPIGSSEGNYRPIGLDFIVANGGEYMLEAELIEGDANYEGIVYPGDLEAVSSLRYWKVTALGPVSQSNDFKNITAYMSYDAGADGINIVATIEDDIKLTKAPKLGIPFTDVWDLRVQGNVLRNKAVPFQGFSILVFGTTNFENNPLPVTLVSFEGQVQEDGVELNWVTASEVNNSHFEVERSTDGENFEQIGRVEGFGTTTVTQGYSFMDANTVSGVVYYRLRQVDFDGAFEYSKIITVIGNQKNDSSTEEFVVSPNPVHSGAFSIAKVGSNDAYATYNVTLQDVSGKVYYNKENTLDSASSELATMVNKLGSGVYLLLISNGDDQQVVRLLK